MFLRYPSPEAKGTDFLISTLKKIGATGFEPVTSCSQSKRSSQAEPRPVLQYFTIVEQNGAEPLCIPKRGEAPYVPFKVLSNYNTRKDLFNLQLEGEKMEAQGPGIIYA
jgi:hypothetical protein